MEYVIQCPDEETWEYVNKNLMRNPMRTTWSIAYGNYGKELCIALEAHAEGGYYGTYADKLYCSKQVGRIYTLQEYLNEIGARAPGGVINTYSIY